MYFGRQGKKERPRDAWENYASGRGSYEGRIEDVGKGKGGGKWKEENPAKFMRERGAGRRG